MLTKINVVSTLSFNVDLTLTKWRCFNTEMRLPFLTLTTNNAFYSDLLTFNSSKTDLAEN